MQEKVSFLSFVRAKSIVIVFALSALLILLLSGLLWFLSAQIAGNSHRVTNSFLRHSHSVLEREKLTFTKLDDPLHDEESRYTKSIPKFDYEKCAKGFRVHVYPLEEENHISKTYIKILNTIQGSKYYTSDPNLACIHILSLDTLDRDKLGVDYIRNLGSSVRKLRHWNSGTNHVIFTLFLGTWPQYLEDLGFNFGNAMIAGASLSDVKLRFGFDISFPLFDKLHPFKDQTTLSSDVFPIKRRIFAAFKGKRYLSGIGSETRNSLHVLHNDKDMLFLTTCKHLKGWQKLKDDRCDADNFNYDRYDYQDLLKNSTFCIVPRGRRLGSFRFLESIKTGCIPVILSNGWELPFSEVIDWQKAVVMVDERSLFHLPVILHSYTNDEILQMRQQGLFIWKSYLSSVEKITMTTLEILKDRVSPMKRSYLMWNFPPGALSVHSEFSRISQDFPFYQLFANSQKGDRFTAMILATSPVRYASSPLFHLILSINQSKFIDLILVVWLSTVKIPDKELWPKTKVALKIIYPEKKSLNTRFLHSNLVTTDAIFCFSEDVVVTQDEIDYAFKTWKSFPDRIVGFTSRTHYWDFSIKQWTFSSRKMNSFSMIMPNAAVFHRYYSYLYTNHLPSKMEEMINHLINCEGIAFNFLVSEVSRKRPILLCASRNFKGGVNTKEKLGVRITQEEYYQQEKSCFKEFSQLKNVPMIKSFVKIDPLLYKDAVSNFRKRYRIFELW